MMKRLIISLCIALFAGYAAGQELTQYNHYIANQGILNPAYNGTRDIISGLMLHRSQWIGMEGAPMNQALNVHGPIEDTDLGVGLVLQNDAIGFTNTFDAMVAGSYKLAIDRKSFISLGLQVGVSSFVYDATQAVVDDYTDGVFQGKISKMGFNAGFGAYYYAENYFAGFSIPKLLSQNAVELSSDEYEYKNKFDFGNMHMYLYGGYVFDWDPVKVKPTMLMRYVNGAPLQFDVTCNVLLAETVWVGLSYRSVSSLVFLSEFMLNRQFTLRYSFDYSMNAISQYAKYGSHEISLQFDFSFNRRPGMRSIRYF